MIRHLTLFLVFIFTNICFASFEPGDILLQSAKCGEFCDSIRAATRSPVDHAAIVVKAPKTSHLPFVAKLFSKDGEVVEAWTPIAKRTNLSEFIARDEGKYIQLRLKPEYINKDTINDVVKIAQSYIGKEYDYHFEESEEKIYCSELVYKAYEKGGNIPVGKVQKISEFDKKTAEGYWTEHFQGKIPWERSIISPAGLLLTDKFYVVFANYPNS